MADATQRPDLSTLDQATPTPGTGHPYAPYDEWQCSPWPLDPTCLPTDWDPENPPGEALTAWQIASEIMWRATAGRFGWCCETLRPCRRDCADGYLDGMPLGGANLGVWAGPFEPMLIGGRVFNVRCGCGGDCSCGPVCEIKLPGPVLQMCAVRIDGVELDPSTYTVYNRSTLVRKSTEDCWPYCQDFSLPDTEPGTWSVTYLRGRDIPPAGKRAVTQLMLQIFNEGCKSPTGGCGTLPRNVSGLSREGVSIDFDATREMVALGRTGIPSVDQWIALVNPYARRGPSAVYTPDLPEQREVTWPGGWH